MSHSLDFGDPALVIALALVAGMVAETLARHLRIPGIVLLLGAGVILGPDLLGWLRPERLGDALQALVGFAVAVILFEGGLNLDLKRLRRAGSSIRRLVTVGALITTVGGAVAARFLLGWSWSLAILFGTLVIVTGPTVINPLLRRIRVRRKLATVLEAEGVLVDAVGAIVAVVALEVVLSPVGENPLVAALDFFSRLGAGGALGVIAGLLISLLLRFEDLVPEGLENIFTLSLVLLLFQLSNALRPESGIVAVAAAGIVVGNVRSRTLRQLREFKEQLTVLLIGMLFVLLAADVRVADTLALGWGGALTVAALVLVVRPLNVLVSTAGSDLDSKDKAFLSWMAPRGIVAAAVSSLFAQELTAAGIPGGSGLRDLVFVVIGATVVLQGLTAGWVAGRLGVRRTSSSGYLLLGANPVALACAGFLRDAAEDVTLVDSNADASRAAEEAGFHVLFGNGLQESLLLRGEIESRAGCLGLTSNDELNLMFVHRARERHRVPRAWVAIRRGHRTVTPEMVHDEGAQVLFGQPRNLDLWSVRLERRIASLEGWSLGAVFPGDDKGSRQWGDAPDCLLPLAWRRGATSQPFDDSTALRAGDTWYLAIFEERRPEAESWLRERGWVKTARAAPEAAADG